MSVESIRLSMYGETLVVADSFSDSDKIPVNFPRADCEAHLGHLDGTLQLVYATMVSKTHYVLSIKSGVAVGKRVPINIDTFGKLRQWCAEQIASVEGAEKEGRDLVRKVNILFGVPDRNLGQRWKLLDEARARDSQR